MDLSGKTALVTGASRGIGAAVFDALGAAGAATLGTATGAAGAAEILRRAGEGGFRGAAAEYDAASAASAASLAEYAIREFGGAPDILVCNAGIAADGLLMRMKEENWARVLRANLDGLFYLSRALVGGMLKKRGGRIVVISSVVAAAGNAGQTNYCAAKAGAEGFARALARETGGRGVTVNAVAPGFIETDMTARLPAEMRARLASQTPLGRAGSPQEVAAAVVFLASDSASYITGHTLQVNGGMIMG
ncbi:MAG: 3-oxoacyl-ACP reductase FabG [Gammaproteobacteria bacterium]